MVNNYSIPEELEQKIRKRDKFCVYCGIKLKGFYPGKGKDKATIEHMNNDGPYDEEWNLAICCNSCNSSKFNKSLLKWLESDYCKDKNINKETVANVIKQYIKYNN